MIQKKRKKKEKKKEGTETAILRLLYTPGD